MCEAYYLVMSGVAKPIGYFCLCELVDLNYLQDARSPHGDQTASKDGN